MTTTPTEERTALLHGGESTLGQAVAVELARRKIRLALCEGSNPGAVAGTHSAVQAAGGEAMILARPAGDNAEATLVHTAIAKLGRLDALLNVCVPTAKDEPTQLGVYPMALLARCLAACTAMANAGTKGTVVNHSFLPAMYAGTKFDPYLPALKGAITGVTRTLCRQFGKAGLRITCVQTGLLDIPETKALASAEVLQVKVPIGRWANPIEVARLMTYLALDNGYISGQCLIMDGGLTAGITGT